MSATMCKIELIGNLGRDPEMRYTPSGQPVTSFSVAATRNYNRGEEKASETIWLRVTAWGKLAEVCNQYLKKGAKVYVEGRLTHDENGSPRIWTRQDGTPAASFEVTASEVRFLDNRSSQAENEAPAEAETEDIPF